MLALYFSVYSVSTSFAKLVGALEIRINAKVGCKILSSMHIPKTDALK